MFKFYDDELHNLILVSDKNLREIIDYTSHYDYHPPVQYLINKISLQFFGLNEFWLSVPSIVFILLAIIICSRLFYQITNSMKLSILTGFLTLINPLILLWGASIRWYPLWTFLIILAAYLFIKLWSDKKKKMIIKIALIITLTLSLYTNYQTVTFLIASVLTVLTLDIKNKNFINLKQTTIVLIGVLILFIPYLSVFMFHLQSFFVRKEIFQGFTGASPLVAGGYFLFSIFFGNSIYPWQPIFIILFTIGTIALLISFLTFFSVRKTAFRFGGNRGSFITPNTDIKINTRLLRSMNIFVIYLAVIYFIQTIVSGTILMRGMIFLPMLLTVAGSSLLYYLYQTYPIKSKIKLMHYGLTIAMSSLIIIWFIGSYNVVTRQHLHKSGLEAPVKQIITAIDKLENKFGENPVVITTDPVLTYYLLKANQAKLLSPYAADVLKLFPEKRITQIRGDDKIIFIKSTYGALLPLKNELDNYTKYLSTAGYLITKRIKFGYDPDYSMKRNFFASAGIEEWKYIVYYLSPLNEWDINYLETVKGFRVY